MGVGVEAAHVSGRVDTAQLIRSDTRGNEPTVTTTTGDRIRADSLHIPTQATPTLHAPGIEPQPIPADTVVDVPAGGTRISLDTAAAHVIAFDTEATLDADTTGIDVTFPTSSPVRVVATNGDHPTITVPPTPTGAATAITHTVGLPLVSGPSRSHPAFRIHPPPITIGDSTTIPDSLRHLTPDHPPNIVVPPDLETVLQVAPLAYYLGLPVTVDPDSTPSINPSDDAPTVSLTPLDDQVPTLLETTFRLDCRIRCHHDPNPPPGPSLTDAGLDPNELAHSSVVDRCVRYLDTDTTTLLEDAPPWHLAAYVDPHPDAIQAVPTLLDRLAHVYPPTATPLAPQTLMERSLDDFYRSRRPVPTVDLVEPTLEDAGMHAWLADDVPVDAFRLPTDTAARLGPATPTTEPPLDVTLVVNDPAMVGEEDTVAHNYRTRSHVPVSLTKHHELPTPELAAELEAETDLLHFIGHCEPPGLVCPDGTLPASSLDTVGARTVFLNACGSYHEGAALVDRGATAAAITYRGVLDGQAETVGAAFARLVTRGFSIERVVGLARRRVMMGMDYGVVGDGTHRLTGAVDPVRYVIDPTETGYRVTCETFADGIVGDTRTIPLPDIDAPRFRGCTATQHLDQSALVGLLTETTAPIIFDGSFAWPDDLLATIDPDSST